MFFYIDIFIWIGFFYIGGEIFDLEFKVFSWIVVFVKWLYFFFVF